MANYLGEIAIFAGNYAPANWMLCQGQLLNISDYSLLYSLLGTRYGGDGLTTFALPDLQCRVAVSSGQGPGLSAYTQGQTGGDEWTTLQENNLPAHNHPIPATTKFGMNCYSGPGNTNTPHNNYPATITGKMMYSAATNYPYMVVPKIGKISTSTGQNAPAPITLVQPVLATNFIICINGDFPPTPTT